MSEKYPSLHLTKYDDVSLINASNEYSYCVNNQLKQYKTADSLKSLLEREDIDSICQDELAKLRSLSSSFGVKETRAIYHLQYDFRQFLH